jgi:hypothetical protein
MLLKPFETQAGRELFLVEVHLWESKSIESNNVLGCGLQMKDETTYNIYTSVA